MTIARRQDRILLVDDEPDVAMIMSMFLKKSGYRVVSTTSSATALQMFLENSDQFALLITDLTMPHLSGIDLARNVRGVRPDIPVILCTGYGEEIGWELASRLKLSACLGKPVDRERFIMTVRGALSQTGENRQST
ncbi:MAG: response regulator [Desulfobacteraceae bacterium]|nr:response regulator [Desulfobacteraceae bacterium]